MVPIPRPSRRQPCDLAVAIDRQRCCLLKVKDQTNFASYVRQFHRLHIRHGFDRRVEGDLVGILNRLRRQRLE